jgi:hypothetical protein
MLRFAQNRIACFMSIIVVEVLEVIEIEHQDAKRLFGADSGFRVRASLANSGDCISWSTDLSWTGRKGSRSQMLDTESPTCAAKVVLKDISASPRLGS